jgi:hypothetical protein
LVRRSSRRRTKNRSVPEAIRCVHFGGDVLRLEAGACCGGKKTRHEVLGCAPHGECQLGNALPGITWCRRCEDFRLPAQFPVAVDAAP